MEAAAKKMACMFCVVVVALLSITSLQLAAAAGDPQLGRLPLHGGGGGGGGGGGVEALASSGRVRQRLSCCNRCRASTWDRWFVCDDRTEMQLGCNFGCRSCRCDPFRFPSCQCLDQLFRCPPPCNADVDGGAVASMAEQLRA